MDAVVGDGIKGLSVSSDESEIESIASDTFSEETADLKAAKQALVNLPLENYEDLESVSELVADECAHVEGLKVSFSKVEHKSTEVTKRSSSTEGQQLNDFIQDGTKKSIPSFSDENQYNNRQKATKTEPLTWELVQTLQSELDLLRKSLREPPPAKATIQKMIMGEEYLLEKYRSKEDKLCLLDEAIAACDGNAITAVVLFLRSTTESKIFTRELVLRPAATEHYISYLKQHQLHEDLIWFLKVLGRTEEAAMLSYSAALSNARSNQEKLSKMQQCHRDFFQSDVALATEAALIHDQINLLPSQLQIAEYDKKNAAQVFYLLPCKASVIGTSVITSLFYLCLYHYQAPENCMNSPVFLLKAHKLSEKQFQWTALRARSQLRNWKDIDKLFETKGFFGGIKMKPVMGFDRVVAFVSQMKAPREVLTRYCSLIDNVDKRLEVAMRFRCHRTAIDTYTQQRDRLQLLKYVATLPQGLQDWTYGTDILNTSTIKWKN